MGKNMSNEYKYCILNDAADILEYEKGLYRAFVERNPGSLKSKNYITDGDRLQLKIDDKDVMVYAIKQNDVIIAACAVDLANKEVTQFEEIGFEKSPEDGKKKIADCLAMYIELGSDTDSFLAMGADFVNFIIDDLKKNNMEVWYATCPRTLKSLYTIMGFDVMNTIQIDNDKECLLRMEL